MKELPQIIWYRIDNDIQPHILLKYGLDMTVEYMRILDVQNRKGFVGWNNMDAIETIKRKSSLQEILK